MCAHAQSRTSEVLTRPSWKEQSLASCVHMWRYLHQWQGKFPLTQDRHLQQARTGERKDEVSMIYAFISLVSFCVYILECPLMEFEFPDPATVASSDKLQ